MPLLREIRSRGQAPNDAWIKGDFDTAKQVGAGAGWASRQRATRVGVGG